MHIPDEFDGLSELARQAYEDTPWRDQPGMLDLSPELVMQWIQGPVRRFLEHLTCSAAVDLVFPEYGFPTPVFIEVEWPPPRDDDGASIIRYVGRSGNGEPRRGNFPEALAAAALLTIWAGDAKYDWLRIPPGGGTLDYIQHQIKTWPGDVVLAIDEALTYFVSGQEFTCTVAPMLRKAGADREAVARLAKRLAQPSPTKGDEQTGDGEPFWKPKHFVDTWGIPAEGLRRHKVESHEFVQGKVRCVNKQTDSGKRAVYWYSEPDARRLWSHKFFETDTKAARKH